MKNLLLSTALIAAGFSLNAQWQKGGTAPDFTETDINGKSINLYSILDRNMAVIIDVSATWCGPCWSYHQTHALESVYQDYGPTDETGGSCELMPLFFEGDNSTGLSALQGSGNTQGNWTAGTTYPIIDVAGVVPTTVGFPTVWLVCPDRSIVEVSSNSNGYYRPSASQAIADARRLCGDLGGGCDASGAATDMSVKSLNEGGNTFCGDLTPMAQIKNTGTNALTSASVTLKINGETIETKEWSGNLASGATADITFQDYSTANSNLNVEYIISLNGDEVSDNNTASVDLEKSPVIEASSSAANYEVTIEVRPDVWGSEITWEILNANGSEVLNGGPYPDNATQEGNDWVPNVDAIVTDVQTLTVAKNDAGCYKMQVHDTGNGGAGDGFANPGNTSWGVGYYKIKDSDGNTIAEGGDFEDLDTREFEVMFGAPTGNADVNQLQFNMYPNPASTQLTLDLTSIRNASVEVYNTLGELVHSLNADQEIITTDISQLDAGIYHVSVKSEGSINTSVLTVIR